MKIVSLEDICEIQVGKTPARANPVYWGEGNPWLSIADMNTKIFIQQTKEQITDQAASDCNCRLIPKNTVLFSFKLSIGKVGITKIPMYTNEAIAALIIKNPEMVLTKFLYFAMSSTDFSRGSNRAVMGKTLNKAQLKKLPIPLPSMDEQKRIVSLLDKADELRRKRRETIELLDEYVESVFLEMFGDPVTNPKGWDTELLGNVMKIEDGDRGVNYPSGSDILDKGILFLSTKNIKKDRLVLNDCVYISKQKYDSLSKGKLRRGDLILTLRGSIGNIAEFKTEGHETGFINAQMAIIRPQKHNSNFLVSLYTSQEFQRLLKQESTGSAQQQLPLNKLKKIRMVIPPLPLQEKFAAIKMQAGSVSSSMQKQNQEIEHQFNALMQKAFR